MRRWLWILVCCVAAMTAWAGGDKLVSHRYDDVSMAQALLQLDKESKGRYVINFMYDELEDFRVTTHVRKKTVPEAIRQMVGHYPISVTVEGDSAIYVECVSKAPARLTGIVVDEHGEPLEFANVTLLAVGDSAMVGGGVTTASGRFVIPYEPQEVTALVTYVGYRAARRRCDGNDAGTIRLEVDSTLLRNVTVTPPPERETLPDKHARDRMILTLNDGSVIEGYLKGDIMGKEVKVAQGSYGNKARKYRLEDITTLAFPGIGGADTIVYEPVMVLKDAKKRSRSLRLLTRFYDSPCLAGFTAPYTAMGIDALDHPMRFTTVLYYYQVKSEGVAVQYWDHQLAGQGTYTVKNFLSVTFKHYPSIVQVVNGKDFDHRAFLNDPKLLMPILDQAVQSGDYRPDADADGKMEKKLAARYLLYVGLKVGWILAVFGIPFAFTIAFL